MSSIEVLVASVANALIAGAIGLLFFGNFFKAAALGFAGSFVALAVVVAIAVQVRRFRERSRGRPRSTRA